MNGVFTSALEICWANGTLVGSYDTFRAEIASLLPTDPITELLGYRRAEPRFRTADAEWRTGCERVHTNGDTYLTVPFDISIRAAPLLPSLFVILGVAGGKFVKYMNGKGNRQADLIIRVERVDKLLAAEDREILVGDLEKARQQIYLGDLDNADVTILSLERRASALRNIDRFAS